MARQFPSLRLAAAMLVAFGLALTALPASAATDTLTSTQPVTTAAADHHRPVLLVGDAAASRTARRASYAWAGRRITYFDGLPATWRWSLATAVSKWNGAGGRIRFVRTTHRRAAQLTISYANIGPAAGLATVGRTSHAFVRLSSVYRTADALDAHYRVEVMMVLTHELGHVLGFAHTHTPCSLMAPMIDVEGCHVISPERPGYYACRTIDTGLVARFVHLYGGRARLAPRWCPIAAVPGPLARVAFTGGAGTPVTISWVAPASVPWGSRVLIRSWQAAECAAVPSWAATTYAAADAGSWQDPQVEPLATSGCYSVQLVNRYGAGSAAVAGLLSS